MLKLRAREHSEQDLFGLETRSLQKRTDAAAAEDDSMSKRRNIAAQKRSYSSARSCQDATVQIATILSPASFFEHKVCVAFATIGQPPVHSGWHAPPATRAAPQAPDLPPASAQLLLDATTLAAGAMESAMVCNVAQVALGLQAKGYNISVRRVSQPAG
jgi:hypothetical protein